MRKLLAGATVVLLAAGAASTASAQLALRGSDTLEDVAKNVIAACSDPAVQAAISLPGITAGSITYAGGGSGTGQNAMLANPATQHIAPMSRPLNGAACDVTTTPGHPVNNGTTISSEQLLIGLDGISIVGANQTHVGGDLSSSTLTQCPDSITPSGSPVVLTIPAQVCSTDQLTDFSVGPCPGTGATAVTLPDFSGDGTTGFPGNQTYSFNSWKEVLAMLYGGQNHVTTAAQLLANGGHCSVTSATACTIDANCPTGETCKLEGRRRNPARINCASPVRKFLADQWGSLFQAAGNCGFGPAATNCRKLKHAFRRADSSGTSDTFVTLVGMIAIPASSAVLVGTPPNNAQEALDPATATANPFCNAGPTPGNKGSSDYLDLDPIRRIADSAAANQQRAGLEQLAEQGVAPVNPPGAPFGALGNDLRADPTLLLNLVELSDFGSPSRQNYGPNLSNPNWLALEQAALKARKGIGLVLPIEVPTNFSDEGAAYWAATAAPGAPVVCTPGVTFPKVISAAVLGQFPACPNGVGSGGCSLPVNTDNPAVPNFNCFNPNAAPLATMPDGRYFNTVAVIPAGTLRVDGYCNGAIAIPCTRQGRAVTAWYRLHTTRATNQGGTNLIGNVPPAVAVNNCKTFDATTQIGCLVKANPCSIGYAGREAVDKAINGPVNNFAYKLGGGDAFAPSPLPPTDDLIYALQDLTATQFYPMSRKLFVNKYVDTTKAETVAANVAAEDALYNCFSSHTGIPGTVSGNAYNGAPLANFWVQKFNFLPILSGPIAGAGPQLDNVCPSVR